MNYKIAIGLYIFLNGCCYLKNNENLNFQIEVDRVFINYHQDDSLNRVRSFVIPRIYYDFKIANSSLDSVTILLNTHFDREINEPPYLYVSFNYYGVKDTLLLTEYESVNPLIISPNSVDRFIVGVPILKHLEKNLYKNETRSSFMKYVADHGVVHYNNPGPPGYKKLLRSQHINRSKNFKVVFADPEDTAVE